MIEIFSMATPKSLKILIGLTIFISLIGAFFPSVQQFLSLSLASIQHFFLWQPFTYLFIHPSSGVSFPFLLHLAFNMYLLWTFGSSLFYRAHAPLFFTLYFGSALFAALSALAAMLLFGLPYALAGSSPALYALLVAWVILNPEADLLLFFAIPFKAYYLLLGLIGANFLIDLSNNDWISVFAYFGSLLFGYIFTILVFREQSPFTFLNPFERFLLRTLERLSHIGTKRYRHSKIYDIHSGNPILDDDQFMDAMLARISLYGEDSLSPEEKRRMKSISARKASSKN